jgi:hypothetical protein
MEAIRKKIKRNGSDTIIFKLPENFKAENLELIILPDEDKILSKDDKLNPQKNTKRE